MHAMSSTTWVPGSTLPQVQSQYQSLGFLFFSRGKAWLALPDAPWYGTVLDSASVVPAGSLVVSEDALLVKYLTTPDRCIDLLCSISAGFWPGSVVS
jgi:hypothetical protein